MEWAAAGFVLEQTTDLANPSGWMDVPGGDVGHVIITSGPEQNFFRLMKP